jgi:hypothetical protein
LLKKQHFLLDAAAFYANFPAVCWNSSMPACSRTRQANPNHRHENMGEGNTFSDAGQAVSLSFLILFRATREETNGKRNRHRPDDFPRINPDWPGIE